VRRNTKEEVVNKKAKVWLPNTNAVPILFYFNELNKVFFKVPLVSFASKFISKYYNKLPFVVTEKRKVSMTGCLPLSHLIYAYVIYTIYIYIYIYSINPVYTLARHILYRISNFNTAMPLSHRNDGLCELLQCKYYLILLSS
jgi:hypothetical protein